MQAGVILMSITVYTSHSKKTKKVFFFNLFPTKSDRRGKIFNKEFIIWYFNDPRMLWQQGFPFWTLTGEKRALRGLTGWTTALDSGISSEQLACCWRGTCHGFQSTVGSATTEIRTLRELGLHTFILRTSLHAYDAQLTDVKSQIVEM